MPHFKMVKNTLWGRRRCTRRRRCCEWDSKRSAWGYWYLNRNIVLTMFENFFPPFQKTLFQHYNIETHLYWVKRKRVLKSWCSLDQMNMILPYYLAPDSTVNLFQTDGWRGRYEATHFFTLTPTVSGRVRRSTTNDQDMLIPGDIEKRVNNAFRRWEYFPFKLIYLFPSSLNSWLKQSLFRLPMTWANVPSGAKGNLVVSADDWENNQRYWDRRGAITFIFKFISLFLW